MNLTDIIGKETLENAEAQEIRTGSGVWESGAYDVIFTEFFLFKSKSGAGMLKCTIADKNDKELTVYVNIKKKDGSDNEIGARFIKGALDAVGVDINAAKVETIVADYYGEKDKEVNSISDVLKKPLKACVRQVHTEGTEYENSNEIEAFLDKQGRNTKGEDQLEAFQTKIEKQPILERKAKGNGTASNSGAPAPDAQTKKSSW